MIRSYVKKAVGMKQSPIARASLFVAAVLVSVFLLTVSFYGNVFDVADSHWFERWQNDSEGLVWGRVHTVQEHGFFAFSGFLQGLPGRLEIRDNWIAGGEYHRGVYASYMQQIGLQGSVFGLLARFSPFSRGTTANLFYALNSFLLASMIVLVAVWASRQFNVLSGVFVVVGCLFSPWLVASARNLYWVPWTMLLPFVLLLYIHWYEERASRQVSQWWFFVAAFASIFVRVANGFEFFTAMLVAVEMPVIFYAVKGKWDIKMYVRRSVYVGCGGIAAFFSAIAINLWQRVAYVGSFGQAASDLFHNIYRRTGIGVFDQGIDLGAVIMSTHEVPLLRVINLYLRGDPARPDNFPLFLDFRMDGILLILGMLTMCLLVSGKYAPVIEKNRRNLASLAVVAYASLSAPILWFALAKSHSFIHRHISFILWYYPAVIILFALGGAVVGYAIKHLWAWHNSLLKRCAIILVCVVVFIWPVYRFYQAWDWGPNSGQVILAQNSGYTVFSGEDLRIIHHDGGLYFISDRWVDRSHRFFLHMVPRNFLHLPEGRREHGFVNMDFDFATREVRLPLWRRANVARIAMPAWEVETISTGQFSSAGRHWQADLRLAEPDLSLFFLSDHNWERGFSRSLPLFFVQNSGHNKNIYIVGAYVEVSSGEFRQIIRVEERGAYLHVHLEGKRFNIDELGFPTDMRVVASYED